MNDRLEIASRLLAARMNYDPSRICRDFNDFIFGCLELADKLIKDEEASRPKEVKETR